MIKLLDFKGLGGLVSGEKLIKEMQMLFGNQNIEDLKIKYIAVASDSTYI